MLRVRAPFHILQTGAPSVRCKFLFACQARTVREDPEALYREGWEYWMSAFGSRLLAPRRSRYTAPTTSDRLLPVVVRHPARVRTETSAHVSSNRPLPIAESFTSPVGGVCPGSNPGLPIGVSFSEQLEYGDAQGVGNPFDGVGRQVLLAALDGPNIGAVEFAGIGESLLRIAGSRP